MGVNEYLKLGSVIKELRLSKGYSAKYFAKLVEITYSTYSNYENGNREPSLLVLERICDKLDISLDELIQLATFPNDLRDTMLDTIIDCEDSQRLSFSDKDFTAKELDDIRSYAEFIKFKHRDTKPSTTK